MMRQDKSRDSGRSSPVRRWDKSSHEVGHVGQVQRQMRWDKNSDEVGQVQRLGRVKSSEEVGQIQ